MEDIALAVQTADCLPVLIADPVKRAVAAVHSGWRGTLERVLLQTIFEMEQAFDSSPSDLIVAVGPGIRACCFEVGPEVADLFEKDYAPCKPVHPAEGRPGKYFLDLSKALEVQMDLAGIQVENRYDLGACTRCGVDRVFLIPRRGARRGPDDGRYRHQKDYDWLISNSINRQSSTVNLQFPVPVRALPASRMLPRHRLRGDGGH